VERSVIVKRVFEDGSGIRTDACQVHRVSLEPLSGTPGESRGRKCIRLPVVRFLGLKA
jgi:hypothetical protein